MAEYLLKVSFVIGIALLFYKLVLQQESFFATNRIYFICSILIAFALPFIQLPQLTSHQGFVSDLFQDNPSQEFEQTYLQQNVSVPQLENEVTNNGSKIQSEVSDVKKETAVHSDNLTNNSFSWTFWLLMLYLFGMAIFILNLLFQIGNLCYKVFESTDKIQDEAVVIVSTRRKQAPCSFFKYIFIYPDEYDFATYEQILAHEKIHVQQGHSWDLLFAEIAVVVLWFNPLIWIYKKEVEKNIEFQTDAILLEQERIDKSQYQLNLLQITVPHKPLSITTNYNQSLLKQRIMMMNAKKSTLNRYWKYVFTVPLFLGALLMLNEPAISQKDVVAITDPTALPQPDPVPFSESEAVPLPEPEVVPSPEPLISPEPELGDKMDMTQGIFYSYQRDNKYCIDFKGNDNHGSWNMNECFDKSLFQKQSDELFVMTRETGTLKLMGALDKEVSQGKYEFTKDATFEKYLADKKIKADNNYIFHLHLHKVDRKYIDYLTKKFSNISRDQILAMAIHEVKQDYIDDLAQAGFKDLNPDKIIAAKIHDVNPSTIKELEALNLGNLSVDKIIALRIHEVNAAFLEELKNAGFLSLTVDDAISAKIHDVDAQFVQSLKEAGFDNLTLDEVLQGRIHDLSPAAIKEIKALGFGDLALRKMIELQIHDVNANYIQALNEAGFTGLTLDQIVQAKIHEIDASSIKEMQSLGFKDVSFEKIVQAKIHGVNASYLSDLKSAGFTGISIDKAIEAKIHGVDSNFIKEAKSKGYNLSTLDEYIGVKIHGLARSGNK